MLHKNYSAGRGSTQLSFIEGSEKSFMSTPQKTDLTARIKDVLNQLHRKKEDERIAEEEFK